jgi:diguanylate cyclase (GGDEF)-like protein
MAEYDSLIHDVTRCLAEDSHNETRIIERLNHLQQKKGDKLYQAILYVLTHLEFPKNVAKRHWQGIMSHRQQMSDILGREISLRVALCDYFFNVNKELENPIIIEIEVYEQAEKLSNMDGLTGLFNRRYFEAVLDREFSRARRFDLDLSLIFIDIDNFKRYNDSHGHLAGDEALRIVGQAVLSSKRMIDVACRYGGEEFVLILPRTPKSGALIVGERIRKRIEALKPGRGKSRHLKGAITISGGIATFPQDASDLHDLSIKADQALYLAKQSGRNRITLFSTDKRRFMRIGIDRPIHYRLLDDEEGIYREARTLNISEGGMLFEVDKKIPVSSTVWVDLKLPRARKVHSFVGSVVYSNRGNPSHYQTGISFIRMERHTRQAVSRYIRHEIRVGDEVLAEPEQRAAGS